RGAAVAVVEQADQGREAERARHQHGLVVALGGLLAERHDVADRLLEFLFGQLYLPRELMQVPHECRHHLAEARIGCPRDLGEHRGGDVLLTVDDHEPFLARVRRLCLWVWRSIQHTTPWRRERAGAVLENRCRSGQTRRRDQIGGQPWPPSPTKSPKA